MRDVVGAGLSVLCLLHCLLPIVLVAFGASFGLHEVAESMHAEWLHLVFLVPIIGLLLYSIPTAYFNHRNPLPAIIAVVGSLLLGTALIIGGSIETPLTMVGSVLVISAHILNRRHIKEIRAVAA